MLLTLLFLKLQSSFLSFFMRFEVSTPDPPSIHDEDDEDYLSMMEDDEDGIKGNNNNNSNKQ